MFRKIYDSLSMPAHLELLVHADYICLKSWVELTEGEAGVAETIAASPKSLTFNMSVEHGAFPPNASGIYHSKLPACDGVSATVSGQTLWDAMPSLIQADHTDIKTKVFSCKSYAWIDPTDPSISSGELTDMACWVIGIKRDNSMNPAFNSTAESYVSKAHPLRTSRQYGGPAGLFVYQPFATDKFNTCSMTLKYNKAYGFSTNVADGWSIGANEAEIFKQKGTDSEGNAYDYVGQLFEAFPHFTVTSGGSTIAADGTDTVNFKMVDKDGALLEKDSIAYLDSTAGYLPKTRVPITAGLGTFKVTALGLASDDTFKVKLGFRNMTGVHDIDYTVS